MEIEEQISKTAYRIEVCSEGENPSKTPRKKASSPGGL